MLSAECQQWLDDQENQFMQPDVELFTHEEAIEFLASCDDVELPENAAGWYSRLSAPGYLDCTEWSGPYETEDEALEDLFEMYGD